MQLIIRSFLKQIITYFFLVAVLLTGVARSLNLEQNASASVVVQNDSNPELASTTSDSFFLISASNPGANSSEIYRITDSVSQPAFRIFNSNEKHTLRVVHKSRLDLVHIQEFNSRFTKKLAFFFADGYYLYHLRKLLI